MAAAIAWFPGPYTQILGQSIPNTYSRHRECEYYTGLEGAPNNALVHNQGQSILIKQQEVQI